MSFMKLSKYYTLYRDLSCFRKSRITPVPSVLGNGVRWAHSTIDQAEVKHFSNKNNDWWNADGCFKLLHSMNIVRTPLIRDRFMNGRIVENALLPLKYQKVLEVGCGGGILTEDLALLGANVTGIDASEELIQVAQEHKNANPRIAHNKPTYYYTTIEEHANIFESHYDGIVASEVIEHVKNPELFVKSCVQALKPGGKILFTTPNRTRWAQAVIIFLCEDVLKVVSKGTHQYEKFLTPEELTLMIENNNCNVEHISGLLCNPLMGTWKASNSLRTVFVLQATKKNNNRTI